MIKNIMVGNILDRKNHADIIIGMNAEFEDVTGIGLPFIERVVKTQEIPLGAVVTFDYDDERQLHMLICHHLMMGGWERADQYVRYGMDFLWDVNPNRDYSIVNIGTGRVGLRDGADHMAIRTAMATSFLPVDLYVLNEPLREAAVMANVIPLKPVRVWSLEHGQHDIRFAA